MKIKLKEPVEAIRVSEGDDPAYIKTVQDFLEGQSWEGDDDGIVVRVSYDTFETAMNGDYIIKDSAGRVSVWPKESFNNLFEELP